MMGGDWVPTSKGRGGRERIGEEGAIGEGEKRAGDGPGAGGCCSKGDE